MQLQAHDGVAEEDDTVDPFAVVTRGAAYPFLVIGYTNMKTKGEDSPIHQDRPYWMLTLCPKCEHTERPTVVVEVELVVAPASFETFEFSSWCLDLPVGAVYNNLLKEIHTQNKCA